MAHRGTAGRGGSPYLLWPQTTIATAAIWNRDGQEMVKQCRKPDIMADAAYAILTKGLDFTGQFLIDEQVRMDGVRDFASYACAPGEPLRRDLFHDA
jgi:citronellol/citronellal dehydrogenase